ncbi:LysR family transcriptional regulator [Hahella sp. CCB-MM4]|uniref:LysR family transcriptional regulator n=1 Tax=Hahella sp. (strain CCB-MM4) TaxID=1926491 RepID=UPI000B9A568F|nr:LysR family transcriptional regulator [Hahella sp. CCB-MM4]OZG75417.1 LysR family transcriptional regulator [Hahella sp. CCB-MM4]
MKALQDLIIFTKTAQLGSLSACARQLDLTPAAASAAVKRLEAELGVALFIRSTRHLRLTQEGEVFLRHCQEALQILDEGSQAMTHGVAAVRGTLQLSAPSDLGRNMLVGWLDSFQQQYPEVEVRLRLTDRIADIYSQPVDLALRYGEPPLSNLVALSVAPGNRRILCASPAYLEQHGTPAAPDELTRHNCLCYMLSEYTYNRWRLFGEDQEYTVEVKGNRVSDDGDVVRRWAINGHGIAYKSALDVARDLGAGNLISLCPEWRGEPAPLNLICADRRQLNPAVRALHQSLKEHCRQLLNENGLQYLNKP